jgi:hypothetical protein
MPLYPCRTCGERFPRTDEFFHQDPSCADGLKHRCRGCASKANREYYRLNTQAVLQSGRERRQTRAEHFRAAGVWHAA